MPPPPAKLNSWVYNPAKCLEEGIGSAAAVQPIPAASHDATVWPPAPHLEEEEDLLGVPAEDRAHVGVEAHRQQRLVRAVLKAVQPVNAPKRERYLRRRLLAGAPPPQAGRRAVSAAPERRGKKWNCVCKRTCMSTRKTPSKQRHTAPRDGSFR